MKIIDKLTLTIFADIILIISIVACIIIFGWLDFNVVSNLCNTALTTQLPSQIILVCSVIFILLSIRAIFFVSAEKHERIGQGVLLENEEGRLMISEETIQNIATTVANSFMGTVDVSATVNLDKENNLLIYINLTVKPSVIIHELSANIQEKVKNTVKQTTDLDVKEVNIKVKNIATKPKRTNN